MKYLSEEQISGIRELGIPFPIFFAELGNVDKITEGLSVTELGANTLMGVPEFIEIEKYNASGMVTTARYILVESYKAHEKHFEDAGGAEDN